jgi:integrase
MARKRGNGEGTIRKRPDGLWEARLSVPGRRAPKSFYGKTQAEALKRRDEAKAQLNNGIDFDADRLTLGEYMERWLGGPLKQAVWIRTYQDYAWLTRKHIIPALGHVKLKELTAEHLDELYARKSNSGLGPRTVGYIHSTIRVALQRAVKKRLIPYNVARDAEPPKQVQREYTTLSREQLAAFFKAAAEAEDRFEAFFIMAALAGPRPGELLALKWQDLKLPEEPGKAGEAMIRRSLSTTHDGTAFRETTKTGKGRAVYLLPAVVHALRAHRKHQLEEQLRYDGLQENHGLVFPSTTGTPMSANNLSRRHFKPLLKRAGLPYVRLYDLRHTFATLWLESGEHPKILQEILGHSRISVTLDTYSHVVPHMQREAMGRFGKQFSTLS